ncbi:YqgE/AlgH family protein [Micavibrio aeruginosavorus]|uniref:YqgE/AlgH family protein n=1 Tax=Micavibrio aeruginosavorus TaxID=349221 RepID=UPI003F4AF310
MTDYSDTFLVGKLLLAMPNMGDSRFQKAVIFMCAHDDKGSMGLVINNPLPGVAFSELVTQLNVASDDVDEDILYSLQVLSGGPVESGRGFVLHSADFAQKDTVRVKSDIHVTGTLDALREIVQGRGPEQMLFVLGYAGWSPGQLEQEIQDNAWLITDAAADLVFGVDAARKWENAIQRMGVNPAMLSGAAGRA